jgi:threonyl-tRNA synthetase
MEVGGELAVLRPSLCPHHALIYRSRGRSYRELPLRIAELGGMYRSELSGAALGMIQQAYRALGIEPAPYRLSLAGPSGKCSTWSRTAAGTSR